jgi:hypothetical protein
MTFAIAPRSAATNEVVCALVAGVDDRQVDVEHTLSRPPIISARSIPKPPSVGVDRAVSLLRS